MILVDPQAGSREVSMVTELVEIPTSTSPLAGLFYATGDGVARASALLMHGNGMNFYSGALRFLPPRLLEHGVASLAYNRHGHDTVSCPTRRPEGNAYQTTEEAVADNDCAAAFLEARGHVSPVVIGHSNGGMLAAHHAARHPETPALVLLSAHCGGAEMVRRASELGRFAGAGFEEFASRAAELVAAGHGDRLMTMPGWYYVTTAASFVDALTNSPELLEDAARISCPVLFIRGSQEDRDLYPAESFAEVAAGHVDVEVIDDCDHFYTGHEDAVGAIVADWLDAVIAPPLTTDSEAV
jgi:pimeloyl-ACP methyl ester carboxylesterase